MTAHLIQPTEDERSTITAADPRQATGQFITTRGAARPAQLMVLYVERLGPGRYNHQVGSVPDFEFIGRLERILENVQPRQKGYSSRPGYR